MQALQCIAASPAWGFFMRLQKMTIWFSRSLLHYLPCSAVAHAEDVHATLYAAISLSLKVIDGIHCGWCANGIGLNATRFNCQNCAEVTPGWCCLVGIQWGFGNIESSFVDWGIDKDGIITYRGRYFTCHSFERRTIGKAAFSQTFHRRRNIDGRERRTTVKAPFSQTCYGRRNYSSSTSTNHCVAFCLYYRITILSGIIHRISRINNNGRERITIQVFVNRIISITCTLNDRKVIV